MKTPTTPKTPLGPALRAYFCSYLIGQRDLSPQTIRSYRDAFRLLLRFLRQKHGLQPDALSVDDLDAPRVLAFLEDLEESRASCARSRNARLAAIRSFFRHAAGANPLLLPVAQRVLAIPMKRFDRGTVGHLTREQIQAVLNAPDATTWAGQRDRLLLLLMYNTGARVSEVTALKIQDVDVESRSSVHILGKGRKRRSVPLWRETGRQLRAWLRRANSTPDSPLLPNARGGPMSRSGVTQRLQLAVARASANCPALHSIPVSPHTIRHTTAMHLLQSGVDLSMIALWLGHESIQTTHQYLDADLKTKREALAHLESPRLRRRRQLPTKALMQFLEDL
ncbi:MAG TPA: site-specific integrase [Pirellulaceae bacterium]|nr:site-specific integrase [Pirellulaceae bacterium]